MAKTVTVELLVSRVGAGFSQNRGDTIEVAEDEAKRLFEANPPQARPARGGVKPETTAAATPATENATATPARKTGKTRHKVTTTKAGKTR